MGKSSLNVSLLIAATTIALVGCTGSANRDQLLKRASFDLKCTKDEISVSKIDSRTRGVRGCGWQATYISTCDHLSGNGLPVNCTWVLDEKQRDD
jgi:hypothetical protein